VARSRSPFAGRRTLLPEYAAVAYAAAVLLAVGCGAWLGWLRLSAAGLGPGEALRAIGVLAIPALAGAKLASWIERGELALLGWEMGNGYRYPGAIFGLLFGGLALAWGRESGRRALAVGDALAPVVVLSAGLARLGCFTAGCCHGSVTDLPWSVRFPRQSIPWLAHLHAGLVGPAEPWSAPVHPLQLYFAATSIGVGLVWLAWVPRRSGVSLFSILLADGLVKWLLEQLRMGQVPMLEYGALASIATGAIGLAWILPQGRKSSLSCRAENQRRAAHPLAR